MDLGEWWWVPIVAIGLGSFLAPIIGYLRRRNGSPATMQGALMIDSSIARDAVAIAEEQVSVLKRIAKALEDMHMIERERDQQAYHRHAADVAAMQRELEDLKQRERAKR